jgi:mRNA interferase RelE/StbE
MTRWHVEFTPKADRQLGKLDGQTRQAIVSYLERVVESNDPKSFGKALVGEWSGFWRYRVGKYRIICEIQQRRLVIEVISIGKRDSVYG